MSLRNSYYKIKEELAAACAASGRRAEDVALIAVSKTHPVVMVEEAALLGQVDFGENRIAELEEKRTATEKSLQWHLIGQLQTNKVKLLHEKTILHTLDRISLAEKLAQRFTPQNPIRCLIQVNCSNEPQKSGVSAADFFSLVDSVAAQSAIEVLGLMTLAEHSDEESVVRQAFQTLRTLSEKVQAQRIFPSYAGWLSMGMSGDFKYAIQEGATHVRIGSAIFGTRPTV